MGPPDRSQPPAVFDLVLRLRIERSSSSSLLSRRLCINLIREMTKRVMLGRQLHERRIVTVADIFRAFTTRRERTTGGQEGEIRGEAGDPIKPSLLPSPVRH